MDVAVKQVVADVGRGSFHTLDEDFPFGHIKVVIEELARVFGLPEEVFGDVTPKLCRTRKNIMTRVSSSVSCNYDLINEMFQI